MSASLLTTPNNDSPVDVVIRFSASIPDLELSVPANPEPTTATLKQLIRAALPANLCDRRIRLIHAGKSLEDEALLSGSIRRSLSPSPRIQPTRPNDGISASDKGKQPVRNSALPRIYIHCSIGDVILTTNELQAEQTLASRGRQSAPRHGEDKIQSDEADSTTPAPRGFDRLLSAGFSASEVQNLRLQFMAIQAHTHTPDTMPSPTTLRNMEDRWLDNSNAAESGGAGATSAGLIDDDGSAGALDDMLWGAALGFFWPAGCLLWGFREEGIWSQRRRMAIVVGVVLNIGIGLIRYTS